MKNVFLAAVIMFCASTARAASIESTFLMTETQDGQPMKDLFEIWTVKADLVPANPKVQIQVSSFVTHVGETSVFPWLHESTSVSQVKPGIYKADLNGRLNPFSGLEVIFGLSPDGRKITTLTGSMRAGSRGQSVSVFKPDFDMPNKKILLINPSYGINY